MKFRIARKYLAPALVAVCLAATVTLPAKEGMKGGGAGMMKHLIKSLDLSDEQVEKFKALNMANGESDKALRDKTAADLANLKVLINKKASDGELSAMIATLKADNKASQEAWQRHLEAGAKILTPMQQAKWVIQMMDRMGGGMRGRGGWKGEGHEGKGMKDADDNDDDDDDDGHEHKGKGGKGKKRD